MAYSLLLHCGYRCFVGLPLRCTLFCRANIAHARPACVKLLRREIAVFFGPPCACEELLICFAISCEIPESGDGIPHGGGRQLLSHAHPLSPTSCSKV